MISRACHALLFNLPYTTRRLGNLAPNLIVKVSAPRKSRRCLNPFVSTASLMGSVSALKEPLEYPISRRDDSVVDDYHGVKIADPYRWLEDPDAEEVKDFVQKQVKLTESVLQQCEAKDKLREKITKLFDHPRYEVPFKRGNKYFYFHNTGLQAQNVLYVQDSLEGEAQVLLDPNSLSEDGTVSLSSLSVSEDAKYLAYGLSSSGSDWVTIKVMRVEDKSAEPDTLSWVKFSGISWTHDSQGFFYSRYPAPKEGENVDAGTETDSNLNQQLYYHFLGTDQSEDILCWRDPENPKHFVAGGITDDGKYLVLTIGESCDPVNKLYYCDISSLPEGLEGFRNKDGLLPFVKLIDTFDAQYEAIANDDTVFTFLTNKDAPKYKVVRVDLKEPSNWIDVIPEAEKDVLESVYAVNVNKLIVSYLSDVKYVLQVRNLKTGSLLHQLPIDIGSVYGISARREDSVAFIGFTSFLTPGIVYQCNLGTETPDMKIFREISVPGFDRSEYEVNQVFVPSKDGTKIPMFIVGRKNINLDGSHPCLLYGYGGFNISLTPTFSVSRIVLTRHLGAFYCVANIRAQKLSILLELSASNDLIGFRRAIEEEGYDIDESSLWYGRRMGSKKLGFEERTPLLVASMFGSKDVVNYIIKSGCVDVNRACGSDGATALHCAAAGGSFESAEVVKILLGASADTTSVDANENRPSDLIAPALDSAFSSKKKMLGFLLKGKETVGQIAGLHAQVGNEMEGQEQQQNSTAQALKEGTEKKEYPVDLTLPDIKNGIYGTDEFRMYTFKVKPCSRAYSHDWTECPFVHPGENARRRDPRKYHYSCVPCPEFRKGSCRQGDNCEYAHGIFECWLHPAQYRTRLCKDETNCTRRVCFFAHKPEELRPLYASTGSAVPSPRSYSATGSSLDVGSMSPLALGSPSIMIPPTSTPPLTPTGATSPMGGAMWPNQSNILPPTLQLPGSRLKAALSAWDMDLDMELFGLESHHLHQHKQLIDEISGISSPTSWNNPLSTASAFSASGNRNGELNRFGGVKPTSLEDIFGCLDPNNLPQLHGNSLDAAAPQLQSPTGLRMRQNINQQLRASYPTNLASSPVRVSPSFGIEPSGPTAATLLSSRSAAFANRSQSFIERTAVNCHSGIFSPASSANAVPSNLSDWGSPDGRLDWGIQGEELNKMRKSASFGFRTNFRNAVLSMSSSSDEPDVFRVQSLAKDTSSGQLSLEDEQQQCHLSSGGAEMLPAWMEQLYAEQEQMVA